MSSQDDIDGWYLKDSGYPFSTPVFIIVFFDIVRLLFCMMHFFCLVPRIENTSLKELHFQNIYQSALLFYEEFFFYLNQKYIVLFTFAYNIHLSSMYLMINVKWYTYWSIKIWFNNNNYSCASSNKLLFVLHSYLESESYFVHWIKIRASQFVLVIFIQISLETQTESIEMYKINAEKILFVLFFSFKLGKLRKMIF